MQYGYVADVNDKGILTASLKSMQDSTQDRWIAVSTVAMWDKEHQMMTKDAMDGDIERITASGEYPELRLWHVRGFKLGMCDRMTRVGDLAVDYGYWFDNPLANAMKDLVVENDGKWKVSRGFFPVKATGDCPSCDSGLMVGPAHFLFGMQCPVCKSAYQSPTRLERLKLISTYTFDITITDVPIVPNTAVSAWLVT